MNVRLDAAAKAGIAEWNRVEPDHPVKTSYVASHVDSIRAALAAADAVMFSDAFIDAAAQEIHGEHGEFWAAMSEEQRENRRNVVRAVITALKGFGDE